MSQIYAAVRVNLKILIYTFPNPCLYQALLFQRMTSSSLLLVTFMNFSYILIPMCPSNMKRSFHNNNKSSNKTKQNKITISTEHCFARPSVLLYLRIPSTIHCCRSVLFCLMLCYYCVVLFYVVLCPACF